MRDKMNYDTIIDCLKVLVEKDLVKAIISKPTNKKNEYLKIVIIKKNDYYQVSKHTNLQVFHENFNSHNFFNAFKDYVLGNFLQINAWDGNFEYIVLISKNGRCMFRQKVFADIKQPDHLSHNREKKYILSGQDNIEPLIDLGVLTKEGKIVAQQYDKYKQINRYLEIIDDVVSSMKFNSLNIIDFGCGKSYLTFIVYYYLTQIKHINANIVGIDLKEEVVKKCNDAATKYGYNNLHFEVGNIKEYKVPFDVDIVMTLHACDTATDFALFNAIKWNAKIIFSVPCCQHELNQQIKAKKLSILSRYGIIAERFSSLSTDAIRANLLEYCGYKTQLLEFVDFSHTPKNIMIRAVRNQSVNNRHRECVLNEIVDLIDEFHFEPTLYNLIINDSSNVLG